MAEIESPKEPISILIMYISYAAAPNGLSTFFIF